MGIAASHVLTQGDSPGPAPNGKVRMYANNSGTIMKVDAAGNEIPVGGSEDADMEKSVYDPTDVQSDAFKRGNHHGTQPATTIDQDANHRFVTDTDIGIWDSKEPGFTKNSAFNKNFAGSGSADTVARSDHNHFGLNVVELDGITTLMIPDTTRSKNLSVETVQFLFAESRVSTNEWMKIGRATDRDTGHIMPHDGTIVGITGFCENTNSNAQYFRLYINGTQTSANFAEFPAGSGDQQFVYTDKDVDFSRGDRIRLRAGDVGQIEDTNISLLVKWRS